MLSLKTNFASLLYLTAVAWPRMISRKVDQRVVILTLFLMYSTALLNAGDIPAGIIRLGPIYVLYIGDTIVLGLVSHEAWKDSKRYSNFHLEFWCRNFWNFIKSKRTEPYSSCEFNFVLTSPFQFSLRFSVSLAQLTCDILYSWLQDNLPGLTFNYSSTVLWSEYFLALSTLFPKVRMCRPSGGTSWGRTTQRLIRS